MISLKVAAQYFPLRMESAFPQSKRYILNTTLTLTAVVFHPNIILLNINPLPDSSGPSRIIRPARSQKLTTLQFHQT